MWPCTWNFYLSWVGYQKGTGRLINWHDQGEMKGYLFHTRGTWMKRPTSWISRLILLPPLCDFHLRLPGNTLEYSFRNIGRWGACNKYCWHVSLPKDWSSLLWLVLLTLQNKDTEIDIVKAKGRFKGLWQNKTKCYCHSTSRTNTKICNQNFLFLSINFLFLMLQVYLHFNMSTITLVAIYVSRLKPKNFTEQNLARNSKHKLGKYSTPKFQRVRESRCLLVLSQQ